MLLVIGEKKLQVATLFCDCIWLLLILKLDHVVDQLDGLPEALPHLLLVIGEIKLQLAILFRDCHPTAPRRELDPITMALIHLMTIAEHSTFCFLPSVKSSRNSKK